MKANKIWSNWEQFTEFYLIPSAGFSYYILKINSGLIAIQVTNSSPYIRKSEPMQQRINKFKKTSFRLIFHNEVCLFSNSLDFDRLWGFSNGYLKMKFPFKPRRNERVDLWWRCLISPRCCEQFFSNILGAAMM